MADGINEDEGRAIESLRRILRESPAVAETLVWFGWLDDDANEHESWAIAQLTIILQEDPNMADTLLGFAWLADGISRSERQTLYYLRRLLQLEPDQAEVALPWLADGISRDEERALGGLRRLYDKGNYGLHRLIAKPWFNDGLSNTELAAIGYLGSIAGRDLKTAADLAAMPFLDSVEDRDTLALRSLHNIMARDADDFADLMSHPKIKDGITDEETKIIAVLGGRTYSYAPGSAEVLLADTGVYIQERLIQLPHTGETLLAVIGVQDPDTRSMDYFEHAVRSIERFMGEPYPIDYLAMLYYDNLSNNANNNFTHLFFMGEADVMDKDWHPGVIAHEAAHWYWRNSGEGYQYQNWITEGSADFLRVISENERIGRPLEPIKRPCGFFDSISELEKANPSREFIRGVAQPRDCYYSLGNRFFLDLYLALGDESFRPAFRSLYLRSQQNNPADGCSDPPLNICRVAAAFKEGASAETIRKVDEVITRWYGPLP